jgi:diguanylate cyclase (GGDEF)-like protein/PAS domain S-box-containing protein
MLEHDGAFYRELIDKMSDGVYFVDRARRITYWSAGAERLTGYRAEDVVGRKCRDRILCHIDDDGTQLCGALCPLRAVMHDGQPHDAHVYLHHADGHRHPVWVRGAAIRNSDGEIIGAVEVFGDDSAVRVARARAEELERLALTDPLTGLGNRRYLEAELETRLHAWQHGGSPFGVLFADIDLFKQVNDRFGHDVGDDVLAMVARTLTFGLRAGDVVARYGGEEFVIIVEVPGELMGTAERLRTLVEASRLVAARQTVEVTISLGGAVVGPGDHTEGLLRRADLALYSAKQAGRNTFCAA